MSGARRSRVARSRRWFVAWLALAVVLALALLANAVRDYLFVWRILAAQQVRHQMAEYVASLEQTLRRAPPPTVAPTELLAGQAESALDPRWVELRRPDGTLIARRGLTQGATFRREDEAAHFRSHEPLFRVVGSATGDLVVEVFPVHGARLLDAGSAAPAAPGGPRGLVVVEVAAPLAIRDTSVLWPIRRNLLIDSAAALALLATVVIAGLGFRSYERGRRLEAQLEIAREVQAELLPLRTEGCEPVRLAALYQPAEQVGGDFYDAFRTSEGRVAIVIGDVSGKGVPAALVTGVIHGAVRSSPWWESTASHERESMRLNRLLCRDASASRYASLFWCYYDPHDRQLHYLNAGHWPPLLIGRDGRGVELRPLEAGGPVLGLLADAEYRQAHHAASDGDLLVLYSDGLVECTNAAGEEYGLGRLRELVAGAAERSSEGLRDAIAASLAAFQGGVPPRDDLTLVVARFG